MVRCCSGSVRRFCTGLSREFSLLSTIDMNTVLSNARASVANRQEVGSRWAQNWAQQIVSAERRFRKLLKELARHTGRFPQLVDSRSGIDRPDSSGFARVLRITTC